MIEATPLSCLLYNNPIAYGTDFVPEQIETLCRHDNLHAVKESSGDIRRITAIRALIGDRLSILVGLDDAIVEGVAAGARGWVAGLVNAMPEESVLLFEHAMAGRTAEARALYEWFLPLLRFDTVPKFVQLIKLVQEEVGLGNARVRAPRAVLLGAERDMALAVIHKALGARPLNPAMSRFGPIEVVDSHTEGEPTRVVIDGWPEPAGRTMLERRETMRQEHDRFRRAVVLEPRGHDAIVGAMLTPPVRPEADGRDRILQRRVVPRHVRARPHRRGPDARVPRAHRTGTRRV